MFRRQGVAIPIETARPVLERLLEEMLGFWDERVIDRREGGYRLGHDRRGRPIPGYPKHVVTQARVAWFFACLFRSPFGEDHHLEWAAHGIDFLRASMWDARHGGFVWSVGPSRSGDARKHVYGQAFALLALSGFAQASGDVQAAALAGETVRLACERAHDDVHGGFLESRAEDWSPGLPDSPSALSRPTRCKTSNTHIHVMEALTELTSLRDDDDVRRPLEEVVGILTGPAIDRRAGTLWDTFERGWTPLPGYPSSYGHDLETAWLLPRACTAARMPPGSLESLVEAFWANALAHGFDRSRGGFFESGPRGRRATDRAKTWWVQAEALVSALSRWRQTGDECCRHAFELTLGWIDRVQADRRGGDWHARVGRFGVPSGEKSGAWKDPYHQGRALLECLELLAPERSG